MIKTTKPMLPRERVERYFEDTAKSAIDAAMYSLSFSDNTVKQLREKLLGKGYSELNTEAAIAYCIEKKYLNEEEHLRRFVASCAVKFYGRRRIYIEAMARGFDRSVMNEKFDEIAETVNFEVNCAKLIGKLNGPSGANNNVDMNKLIATLGRYGYNIDEVRSAYKLYMSKGKRKS